LRNTDITGFTNGQNGRILVIINNSSKNLVFHEESLLSTDVNRISLGISIQTVNTNQTIMFIYSSVAIGNRWVMLSHT